MYVPRATYSFSTSFCAVPAMRSCGTPCFCPTTAYIATSTDAGALIVIEVLTWSSGMPSNIVSMSASVSIATPPFPTSPSARPGARVLADRPEPPAVHRRLHPAGIRVLTRVADVVVVVDVSRVDRRVQRPRLHGRRAEVRVVALTAALLRLGVGLPDPALAF